MLTLNIINRAAEIFQRPVEKVKQEGLLEAKQAGKGGSGYQHLKIADSFTL